MRAGIALLGTLLALALPAAAAGPGEGGVVDLTHAFDARTLYWPTAPSRFVWKKLTWGETEAGWFYAAGAFSAPEHGGTHLDAPVHFAAGHQSVERIPLERLIGPALVIDVSERAAADPVCRLQPEDVRAFEKRHGRIEPGSIVLLRTGWGRFWPDAKAYLGDDTPGDASKLRFPSYGEEAAQLLVERGVAGLGVDTASIDYGPSRDFPVHRVAAAGDVYGLENLAGLDRLPARGATVIALPMKIAGGSGAPVRAVALLPRD